MSRSYYRSLISTAVPLLCDTVAGAYFGVSLRKLRAAYSWSCIRVQRSSDNTQANIGFVNDELDISALLSFVGGSNGTVVTFTIKSVVIIYQEMQHQSSLNLALLLHKTESRL